MCGQLPLYDIKGSHETGNVHGLYAVDVVKAETGIVGHLPKKISIS